MNKILQKRFVMTAMIAVSVLMILMYGIINFFNIISLKRDIEKNLFIIYESNEKPVKKEMPEHIENMNKQDEIKDIDGRNIKEKNNNNEKIDVKLFDNINAPFHRRNNKDIIFTSAYFVVNNTFEAIDENIDISHIASIDLNEAKTIADKIFSHEKIHNDNSHPILGREGKYYYLCMKNAKNGKETTIILDISNRIQQGFGLAYISFISFMIVFVGMFLFILLLSKAAIKPYTENIEKQKRFITDAGHEIKTPLAIIRANADALELVTGENKWITNIKNQQVHLDGLMKNLLSLAKFDESVFVTKEENLKIDEVLSDSIKSFLEPMNEKNIEIKSHIENEINFCADINQIKQLISIFLDNAYKYAKEDSTLRIEAFKKNKKIKLLFENECENLPKIDPNTLFDRFYRADEARNQKSGGYGIGLSIAKSIVQSYKGKIKASYKIPNIICFEIQFPQNNSRKC